MPLGALINSFNAGELSPLMEARSDIEKYRNGCVTLENFVITPYGGVLRRPGTEFLGAAKFGNRRCRLIGFNFSTTTRFVIEMGHLYLRFWSNGVQVLSGSNPLELASPYPEEVLREVQFVQINDIMYLVHPDHAPRKLSRIADNNWTLSEVLWDWPATLEENVTNTTLALSHVSGNNRTLTASSATFTAQDVGAYYLIGHNTEAAYIERNIDGNGSSTGLTVLGDWEFSTSGVWTAELNVEQSDDGGATWEAIRTIKGSADRNVVLNGKTEREVLLRIRVAEYATGAAWSNNATYAKDDVRIYEGNVYRCVLAHTNTAPAWDWINKTYAVGDLVTFNTKTYKCVRAHNSVVSAMVRNTSTGATAPLHSWNGAGQERLFQLPQFTDYVFDFPADPFQTAANRVYYAAARGYWRAVAQAGPDTFAQLRQDNNVQLLSTVQDNNGAQDILVMFEMGRAEEKNYRPSNAAFWEPIDFTPFNAKYWTPINFETRVARLEKLDARQFGIVRVTAFNSATSVTVNVLRPAASTAATTVWSEGAWSTRRGFPRSVTLHEGRIWFGGTERRPLSIWASTVEDYENFRQTSDADGSLFLTLSSKEANRINWLDSQDKLMIGTSGNEWTLGSGNSEEGIRPDNVVAKKQSSYGSKYLPVMSLNDVMLFVQRQGRKVRELVYVLDRDGWVAPDLTVLAEHITKGDIVECDYQQQNDAIYWAVRGDGQLIGMTYERDQNVVGWHRHTTDGAFESVATIYGLQTSDEVWLAVQRTVGGQPVRYIERFYINSRETFEAENKANWWYLDCAVRKHGTPGTTVSGLSHLNGRTVDVLEDGAVGDPRTVSGGQITLEKPRTTVLAGLPFVSTLQPMNIDVNNLPDGTSRGRRKRIHRMSVTLQKSLGGEVSTNGTDWDWLYPRDFTDPMDQSPAPFSGEKEVVTASEYNPNLPIYVRQTQPYPLTVLALVAKLDIYGD
jgi:hypothetical protein